MMFQDLHDNPDHLVNPVKPPRRLSRSQCFYISGSNQLFLSRRRPQT
jgi:hypothetical protein